MTVPTSRLSLATILKLDAAACAAMGGALIMAAAPVADLTALPAPLLLWAGVALLPVAVFIAAVARIASPPAWALFVIVAGNLLWVLASLALPVTGLVTPNPLGWAFLVGQSAMVALLAGLEWASANRNTSTV